MRAFFRSEYVLFRCSRVFRRARVLDSRATVKNAKLSRSDLTRQKNCRIIKAIQRGCFADHFFARKRYSVMNVHVKEFDVFPDEQKVQTQKLQAAIDRCAETGGGEIIFDAGVYPLRLLR